MGLGRPVRPDSHSGVPDVRIALEMVNAFRDETL